MADVESQTTDVTMHESFGARVRRHREARDISLRTIADQTKIKASLLEGLERGDISQWPAGLFRRAYVRAYAIAIGLDPDTVVREFLQEHPEPAPVIETAPPPPPRLRGLVGSAMGSLSRLRRSPPPAAEPPAPVPPAPRRDLAPRPEPTPRAQTAQPQGTAGYVPSVAAVFPPAPPAGPVTTEPDIDLVAAAQLCTELGRVDDSGQIEPLLQDAAKILDAVGLIVWVWDGVASELRPALVHGYSDKVLAQLPAVHRDDDNITAAAFRSGGACAISGSAGASDALVVPLLTPAGCAGALALELPNGRAQASGVRAVAMFFAAMLAQLVGGAAAAEAQRPASAHAG